MIIRNASVIRTTEPIWIHQHEPVRQRPSPLASLAVRLECARGRIIYIEDNPVDYWYRVESGILRRFSTRVDGRRQIVDLLLPGDAFGFGAEGRHHFTVEAISDGTVVARYPRSRVETLAQADLGIARELRDATCAAMRRLHALILNLGRTTAEEKVGHFLLGLADRLSDGPADRVVLPISREDIADYLALSVETVSRSLTRLKRRRVIRLTQTREVVILDRTLLAERDRGQSAAADRHDPDQSSGNRTGGAAPPLLPRGRRSIHEKRHRPSRAPVDARPKAGQDGNRM